MKRAEPDRSRPKDLAWTGMGAALGLVAALAAWRLDGSSVSPGPLALPHTRTGITCASCHDAMGGAASSCGSCHAGQTSTRPEHRALASKGELGCTTCHSAHGETQGVRVDARGEFVRFGHGREETGSLGHAAPAAIIPLVPGAACIGCHEPSKATDPAARCFGDRKGDLSVQADLCMDEHRLPTVPSNGPRVASWDAAREVAAKTAWIEPAKDQKARPVTWALVPLFSAGALVLVTRKLRSRESRPVAPPPPPVPAHQKRRLPQIDASTCLGCYACIDACPFDVLEVQRYVAVVARPADCCGVVACAEACPNASLTIAEEGPQLGVPRVDEHLESIDAPGVFLAGDLTGVPLIRNAIEQGWRVVDRIASRPVTRSRDVVDVAIVGAGPAGLSAALRAKALGLSFVVLEQSTVAASVQSFPRDKLVFDRPPGTPVAGGLWLSETTKEELLLQWSRILRKEHIVVREHERVTSVDRTEQEIAVSTDAGSTYRARHLVLAMGRRGSPRVVDFVMEPGAECKVSYSLADARSFAGKKVLVVGLGDSAMEASLALASQPGAEVTISYRGASFTRGKSRNILAVQTAVAEGKLRILWESELASVGRAARLRVKGLEEVVLADAVLLLVGGQASVALVRAAGVRFEGDGQIVPVPGP